MDNHLHDLDYSFNIIDFFKLNDGHNFVFLNKVAFMKNRRKIIKNRNSRRKQLLALGEDALLLDSARIASSKAVRSSIALGLTYQVIRDSAIIAVNPDQTTTVLRTISKPKIDTSSLRKGMILERK